MSETADPAGSPATPASAPPLVRSDSALDEVGLGRLSVLSSVREVWAKEASDFTPWLFGNLDLLAQAIGISLEPDAMEHPIGSYRLDILARDGFGRPVAIENQVEAADHTHLGQLLLYSAHVEAETAIWIAPRFSDQHRQALIWLNESTRDGVRFFGVEVSVVRIGTSPPAPVFNVVVRPNDLQKADVAVTSGDISELTLARRSFMTTVLQEVAKAVPGMRVPTGSSYTSYMTFKSGPFGTYALVFGKDQRLRAEIYLDSSKDVNKALFDELVGGRESWENSLGFELEWHRLDDAKASRLATSLDFWIPGEEGAVDAARLWAIKRVTQLINVFDTTLRQRATALNKALVTD